MHTGGGEYAWAPKSRPFVGTTAPAAGVHKRHCAQAWVPSPTRCLGVPTARGDPKGQDNAPVPNRDQRTSAFGRQLRAKFNIRISGVLGPQAAMPWLGTEPSPAYGCVHGPIGPQRPENGPGYHTDTKNQRRGGQSRASHNTAHRALLGHKSPHLGLGSGPNPASRGSYSPIGPQRPEKYPGGHVAITFPNRPKPPPYDVLATT